MNLKNLVWVTILLILQVTMKWKKSIQNKTIELWKVVKKKSFGTISHRSGKRWPNLLTQVKILPLGRTAESPPSTLYQVPFPVKLPSPPLSSALCFPFPVKQPDCFLMAPIQNNYSVQSLSRKITVCSTSQKNSGRYSKISGMAGNAISSCIESHLAIFQH